MSVQIRVRKTIQREDAPSPPSDMSTCVECVRELFDPTDRRYRYPFINCTSCGPGRTVTHPTPPARASIAMSRVVMCAACQDEYDDPTSRRFQAQPNACPDCGPRLALLDGRGASVSAEGSDALAAAAAAMLDGAIVAMKGLGGYHVACRADDEAVVTRLRRRTRRDRKPFAVMVANVREARAVVALNARDTRDLVGRARPIVLASPRCDALVSAAVAPGSDELGVMLPHTPLHHLLLAHVDIPLVMTSGDVSDEPPAVDEQDALSRLGEVADFFLLRDARTEARPESTVLRLA